MLFFISLIPSSSNAANAPYWAILDAPLKSVVIILFQSLLTKVSSSNLRFFGTTVQPRRTPVNPIGFEKELISIAASFAPLISYMDFGRLSSEMNRLYAESYIIIDLFFLANSTNSLNCFFVTAAPVGLFGLQKNIKSVFFAFFRFGKKLFSGLHSKYSIPSNCCVF